MEVIRRDGWEDVKREASRKGGEEREELNGRRGGKSAAMGNPRKQTMYGATRRIRTHTHTHTHTEREREVVVLRRGGQKKRIAAIRQS